MSETLQSQSYEIIRRGIILSRYVPGSRINLKVLCDEIGMGRTPVREALVRLQQEGLVETVPQSGTYVSKIDLKASESARFIREHLEQKVAIEACTKVTGEDVTLLRSIIEGQEEAVATSDSLLFFETDNKLHQTLYDISGYGNIWLWLDKIDTHLDRLRWLSFSVTNADWRRTVAQHRAIAEAVIAHNPNEASYQATKHMHNLLIDKFAIMRTYPAYFSAESLQEAGMGELVEE